MQLTNLKRLELYLLLNNLEINHQNLKYIGHGLKYMSNLEFLHLNL